MQFKTLKLEYEILKDKYDDLEKKYIDKKCDNSYLAQKLLDLGVDKE
jgi:hypothetical protein